MNVSCNFALSKTYLRVTPGGTTRCLPAEKQIYFRCALVLQYPQCIKCLSYIRCVHIRMHNSGPRSSGGGGYRRFFRRGPAAKIAVVAWWPITADIMPATTMFIMGWGPYEIRYHNFRYYVPWLIVDILSPWPLFFYSHLAKNKKQRGLSKLFCLPATLHRGN